MGGRNGFTLVEVMIVLAIAAILTGFAVPALRHYSNNVNLKTAARTMATDFFNTRARTVAGQGVDTALGCSPNVPPPYRITLDATANSYAISRCTACPSTYTNIETRRLADFGTGIIFDSDKTTITNYNIQTRGTVSNGRIVMINNNGNCSYDDRCLEATITISLAGRTHVKFTLIPQ